MSELYERIKVYSNWCYIDQLNGQELVEGEKIEIKWPECVKKHIVHIETGTGICSEQGSLYGYKYPIQKAWINESVNGEVRKIYIFDLMARRLEE